MSPEELLISGRERLAEDEAAGIETEQEQIPEDPRAGWPVLPAGRTIDDIVAGDRVFAFPIVAGDGTRKLMPGIVEKVVPYHIPPHSPRAVNEGSPGFANIHFDEYPWRVVGLDLNQNELIPADVMPALRRDRELLETWLANGLSDGRRRAPELRAALEHHFAGRIAQPASSEQAELPDPRITRDGRRPRPPMDPEPAVSGITEELVARLESEYLGRAKRGSLNVLSAREERALFARRGYDSAAAGELYRSHLGLVAFLVRMHDANGRTPVLMRRGSQLLREAIDTYRPAPGHRFVDYALVEVDERL